MRIFIFSLSFIFSLLITTDANATIISEAEYPFPIKDPYISTISSAANVPSAPYEIVKVEIRKDRRQVPLLEDRNPVPLGLFEQKGKNAPLALIISGTGGTALSGNVLLLASQLYLKGYHAITLPDPVSWHYVLGVSESALPGYPLRDATEYYEFIKKVISHLKSEKNIQFSSISLVGYSYGGLLSGFLAKQDESEKAFNFEKVIILNPPLNVKASLMLLDNYYEEYKNVPQERRRYITSELLGIAVRMQESGFKLEAIAEAAKKLQLTPTECQWLIGESFRQSLGDVIYTSQQVKDLGLLKSKASSAKKSERFREARNIGFREFFIRFIAPSLKPNRQTPTRPEMEKMLQDSDFHTLLPLIKESKNIFVITNKDDFLVTPEDIDLLESTLRERFILYPYGGHMGNLWFPVNKANFERIMTPTY